jgi:DNA-binding MarR family transcriptional regulator
MSIYELAKQVSLGKSTLTNALDRLEASGEVKRVRSADDRRKIVIELTQQNKATHELYEEVSRKMTKLFYRGFSSDEVARFERDLERILRNVTE